MSNTARRANAVFWQRKPLWLDVAKDKVVSRRQTMQYGKAKPTRQRRILVKENAIPLRRCPEYAGWRAGVFRIGFSLTEAGIMSA